MTIATPSAEAVPNPTAEAAFERVIDTGALALNVAVRRGDPTRTPLLLMNGIGVALPALQKFVDALDPDLPVVRFDAPGVGRSPVASAPYSMRGLSAALADILDGFGMERVDVLGLSWGGALAQQFALSQRTRLRKLVLIGTGASWAMVPASPAVLRLMATPRRHSDPGFMRAVAPRIYGGSTREDATALSLLKPLKHGRSQAEREQSYIHQLLALATAPPAPFLRLIRKPVLVLVGDDDPIIPPVNGRILSAWLPNARRHTYRGGHIELVARPRRIAPLVERFLAD